MPLIQQKQIEGLVSSGGSSSFVSDILGFGCTTAGSKVITVPEGVCRDSTDSDVIELTAASTVDFATTGAGGLDTGTFAADTWYYIFVIKGSSGVSTLGSVSPTAPTLPSGYTDAFRHVCQFISDSGASDFVSTCVHLGEGQNRYIGYTDGISATALFTDSPGSYGGGGAWATKSAAAFIPPNSVMGDFNIQIVHTAGGANIVGFGGGGTSAPHTRVGVVHPGDTEKWAQRTLCLDGSQSFDYDVLVGPPPGDAVDVSVQVKGYWYDVSTL